MVNHISFPGLGLSFDVKRSLFSVFGMPVYSYGLIIGLGVVLAFIYAIRETRKKGISQDEFLNMFLIAVPVAVICARLYYVIFSWDYYSSNPSEILNIRGGGLAIYGGVLGAFAVVLIYCHKRKINIGTAFDILALSLLIGQAIGRWGNFVNGEAFGGYTSMPWAMTIQSEGVLIANSVHPTFLYESILNTLGFLVLCLYKKRQVFDGELACCYLIWYGSGRLFIEGLRADSLYLGPFKVSQLLSAILVMTGLILIIKNYKKHLTNKAE